MEKYLATNHFSEKIPKPKRRGEWKRRLIELNGRLDPKYRRHVSSLLLQSYSQIGTFPHCYGEEFPCSDRNDWDRDYRQYIMNGISALQFDSKGIYLVSVTKFGCLTLHDFETLFCQATNSSSGQKKEESKCVLHMLTGRQLDAVSWNPSNQDEVACTSAKNNEVYIYDIGYVSSEPAEILRTRPTVTVDGTQVPKGLTDIAFTTGDKSRLFASDTNGVVNIWDRRINGVPCQELMSNSRSTLNTIKLNFENQVVFAAGRLGVIYMWDIRGGKGLEGFQNHKEVCQPPVASWKLSSMLEQIGSLKAQADIVSKEVHSIDIDPSCPHQLAFHLDDGWSGVLNTHSFKVTHVHCPPPAWLDSADNSAYLLPLRKPSWLPTGRTRFIYVVCFGEESVYEAIQPVEPGFVVELVICLMQMYAVGSSSNRGIHRLDFYRDATSPCHIDYREDTENKSQRKIPNKQNRFVPLSERVNACAAHPLNGTIVAGTKFQQASLLLVTQRKHSEAE